MGGRLEKAYLLRQSRRDDLAERELRALIQDDPHNGSALAMLAMCLLSQGRSQEATEAGQHALLADPDSAYVHYCSAVLDASRKRLSHALKGIDQALRLCPQDTDYLVLRAGVLARMGRIEESQATLSRVLRLSPDCVSARNLRAVLVGCQGRPRRAYRELLESLSLDPNDDDTHRIIGWHLLERGECQAAVTHFQEALRINPESTSARGGFVRAMTEKQPIHRLLLRPILHLSQQFDNVFWLAIALMLSFNIALRCDGCEPGLLSWPAVPVLIHLGLMSGVAFAHPLGMLALYLNSDEGLRLSSRERAHARSIAVCLWAGAFCMLVSVSGATRVGAELAAVALQLLFPLNAAFSCEKRRAAVVMWGYFIVWFTLCLTFLLWTWYSRLFGIDQQPTQIAMVLSVLLPVAAGQADRVRWYLFKAERD